MLVEIKKIDNIGYQLILIPSDVNKVFDGHDWASLIQIYCDKKNILIEDVCHDPESDMYSAISSNLKQLESIKKSIKSLIKDSNLSGKLLIEAKELINDKNTDALDHFAEDYLNWMNESGYDMSFIRQFRFEISGFKNAQQAEFLKIEIEKKGYEVYLHIFEESVYIFQVIVHLMPSLNAVKTVESYIHSLVFKNNLDYIHFKVHNIENA